MAFVTKVAFAVLLLSALCLGRTIIDLTHTLAEGGPEIPMNPVMFPNFTHFKQEILASGYPGEWNEGVEKGLWLSIGRVEYFEHYGTHIDAPSHFGKGRQELHEIPHERLIGPGVVINVKEKARNNANYEVSMEDLIEYEEKYGQIPPNAVVMMNSGWSRYYPDPVMHLGATNLSDITTFNFPGFGLDACKFLLAERQVSIFGTDTNSIDPGQPSPGYGYPYPCHFHLQPDNVPLLENLSNLDSIPPNGTTIFIGGIKTRGGTGGPARVLAIIDEPEDTKPVMDCADMIVRPHYLLLLVLVGLKFTSENVAIF